MKLKVCGMKYQYNITEVAQLQPDYLGFIFYNQSSRFFEGSIPEIPESIKKVGVFVDASLDYILTKIETHNLQVIQLHGNESVEFCDELRIRHSKFISESHHENLKSKIHEPNNSKYKTVNNQVQDDKNKIPATAGMIEIIKVFSIQEQFDFSELKPFENVCDYFLFDTKGKLPGGNGYTFNWSILEYYPSTKPFFLSGGIGLDEIEDLKSFKKTETSNYCHAIDVNSKFEIKPGLKNKEELEKFKTSVTSSKF
jgi:phosphoribosylanthranilate isomerase